MKTTALSSVLFGLATTFATGAVVVTNGDFETDAGLFSNFPGYVGGTNPAAIPGWDGPAVGIGINVNSGPFDDPSTTSDGAFAFIQNVNAISQTLNGFSIGGMYTISLDINARGCCGGAAPLGEILIDDVVIASSADAFPAPGAVIPAAADAPWYHFDIPFTATAETHTLKIMSTATGGGDATLVVDNVTVIPEPSALALGLLGASLFVGLRRR